MTSRQAERQAELDRTEGPFRAIQRFLEMDFAYGQGERRPTVLTRVKEAALALRAYRRARGQDMFGDYEHALPVRICADQFGIDIADAAGERDDLDPYTIRWVLAGLRCPWRPFCRGCPGCFTIDSPLRPTGGST